VTGVQQGIARAVVLLSVAGMAVSGYLTYARWTHSEPFCANLGGCAQVAASPYAEVRGVPVALLGLGYYTLLAGMGGLSWRWGGQRLALAIFGLALAGFLYSAYLTYLEVFVIYAVCLWCVVSALLVTGILALSLAGLRPSGAG